VLSEALTLLALDYPPLPPPRSVPRACERVSPLYYKLSVLSLDIEYTVRVPPD